MIDVRSFNAAGSMISCAFAPFGDISVTGIDSLHITWSVLWIDRQIPWNAPKIPVSHLSLHPWNILLYNEYSPQFLPGMLRPRGIRSYHIWSTACLKTYLTNGMGYSCRDLTPMTWRKESRRLREADIWLTRQTPDEAFSHLSSCSLRTPEERGGFGYLGMDLNHTSARVIISSIWWQSLFCWSGGDWRYTEWDAEGLLIWLPEHTNIMRLRLQTYFDNVDVDVEVMRLSSWQSLPTKVHFLYQFSDLFQDMEAGIKVPRRTRYTILVASCWSGYSSEDLSETLLVISDIWTCRSRLINRTSRCLMSTCCRWTIVNSDEE